MEKIKTWPGWTCVKEIGKGGFGSVYEIQREEYGKVYRAALKVISIPKDEEDLHSMRDMGMSEEDLTTYYQTAVQNLSNEFALMADLKGISNIVSYEDHMIVPRKNAFGWDILIRMELLTPLSKYVRTHDFHQEDVVKMGIGLCKALEICKRKGILHRDIKPANVFVSSNGDYKLGDFGVSRFTDNANQASTKVGTYHYMAPEIYKGSKYGHQADLYSLGMVLYQYLNDEQLPFIKEHGKSFASMSTALEERMNGKPIPKPTQADSSLSAIVLKCLEPNPKNRYASATQLRQALEKQLVHSYRDFDEQETIVENNPYDEEETIVETQKKYCSRCGKPMGINDLYCSYCAQGSQKKINPIYYVLVVLLCAGIGLGGYMVFHKDTSNSSEKVSEVKEKKETEETTETKEKEEKEEKEEEPVVEEVVEEPVQMIFGPGSAPSTHLGQYYVNVQKGYLALRTQMVYDDSNIIGQMYNGDYVWAIDTSTEYWYVYSPSLGMYGYTNPLYLANSPVVQSAPASSGNTYYASVQKGYLALRTERAYDDANIIGQIQNGEPVEVLDTSYGTYWYVYAPTLGAYGFVNSDYLVQ